MSKGKKITSIWDIIDRPIYREIMRLLAKENKEMTTAQIKASLFPEMKDQTLNTYLKTLTDYELVMKNRRTVPKRPRTTYKAVTNNEIVERIVSGENDKVVESELTIRKTMDDVNNILMFLNSGTSSSTSEINMRQLAHIQDFIIYDSSTKLHKLNCEAFQRYFPHHYQKMLSASEFIKYKLNPVLDPAIAELKNFLEVTDQKPEIKIVVEYGDGKKVELS